MPLPTLVFGNTCTRSLGSKLSDYLWVFGFDFRQQLPSSSARLTSSPPWQSPSGVRFPPSLMNITIHSAGI